MSRTRLLTIFLMTLILVLSCSMDMNLNGGNDTMYGDSANWMSRLSPDTLIRNITIPGTHNSCANYDLLGLSSISSTQDLTLKEQLEAGIRCLDIRIMERDGEWGVYHGPKYMKMNLDDVVQVCREFLEQNPTEFILMFIQYENGHHRLSTPAIEELRKSDTELFYQGSSLFRVKLTDVAGKVIPAESYIRIYGEPDLVSENDFWTPDDLGDDYEEEDFWSSDNPQVILDNALYLMNLVRTNNRSYTSLPARYSTSAYFSGQFGIPNYRIMSSVINPVIQKEFEKYEGSAYFGVVSVDHATRELIHSIYSCNALL